MPPTDIDYPNLVWEMYATSPEGDRVYCGSAEKSMGANLFASAISERGYTDFEKRQVLRGNDGYSLLPRMSS